MVLTRTHIPSVPKHQTAAKNMTQVYLLLSCSYSHPQKMPLGWRVAFSFDIPKQDKVSKIESSNNSSSKSKTAKCLKKFYHPLSSYFAISSKNKLTSVAFSLSLSLSPLDLFLSFSIAFLFSLSLSLCDSITVSLIFASQMKTSKLLL